MDVNERGLGSAGVSLETSKSHHPSTRESPLTNAQNEFWSLESFWRLGFGSWRFIFPPYYQPGGKNHRSPLRLFFHDFPTKTRKTQLFEILTKKDAKMGQHGTNKTDEETPRR